MDGYGEGKGDNGKKRDVMDKNKLLNLVLLMFRLMLIFFFSVLS